MKVLSLLSYYLMFFTSRAFSINKKDFILIFFFISTVTHAVELTDEQFNSDIAGWSVSNASKVYYSSDYSGSMFIDRDDTASKTYSYGAAYANQTLTIEVQWCATNEWESSDDYLRINVNDVTAKQDYNGGGCQSTTFTADADVNGDFKIEFSPITNRNDEDAYIKYFTVNGTPVADAEIPPVMGGVPDQTISIGTPFSLDISPYVTLTNADPILAYTLTGSLPAGLDFNTTTGILSGTPTEAVTTNLSVTATDNDGISNADSFTLKPIEVGWEQAVYQTNEDTSLAYGDTSAMPMVISIDHAVNFPISVSLATSPGTATADSDYRSSSTTVTIPAGDTSVTVYMDIFHDEGIEITEDFTVTLSNPTGTGGVILKENYDVATVNIMEQTTAPLCYSDDFNSGILDSTWRTLKSSGTFSPEVDNNRLRLTPDTGYMSTAVTKDYEFPSFENLIILEFTHYSYGGNGADGFAAVLYDTAVGATPTPGAFGGSLGYAQKCENGAYYSSYSGTCSSDCTTSGGCAGFEGGWLGLGLDEYGNYQNPTEGRIGGTGSISNSVAIRGDGSGVNGYELLEGTSTLSPTLWDSSLTANPGDKFRMTIDARDPAHLYIRLERKLASSSTYTTIINQFDAKDATYNQSTTPDSVRLALTASTGASHAIHEIDDISVWGRCTPYSPAEDNATAVGFDIRETSIGIADNNRSITTKITNKPLSLNVVSLDTNGSLAAYDGVNNSRVYLFVEDSSVCSMSDVDKRTAIASEPRNWYVTFNKNDTYQTTPNYTSTIASQDKKIVMNYINWSQVFENANFNCSNSNTQAVLKGVPQCLNSNTKLAQVFPDLVNECLGGAKPACESNSYAASGVPSAPYDNEYGCYQCLAGGAGTISCSTDNFAIRPDSFSLSTPSGENINLLTSAQEYTFPLTAVDGTSGATNNYTVTNANSVLTLERTMYQPTGTVDNTLNGTLSFSATPFSINNGVGNALIAFDDIGKVNIQVRDTNWSAVDSDDTPGDCSSTGRYICGDVNATFIPEHFTLSNVHLKNDNAGNFTYLSNDLSISAHLDVNVTAKNLNDAVTQNFKSGSWENPVDINISVSSAASTPTINKDEIDTTQNLGFSSGSLVINWNETNSTKKLMFNFNRDLTDAKNPFRIDGSEVTLSAKSTYSDSGVTKNVTGSNVADQNATFVYGRTHATRQRFNSDNGTAFIYFESYCTGVDTSGNTCNKSFLPNGVDSNSTDDPRWFVNTSHTSSSGIAGSVAQKGGLGFVNATNASTANPAQTQLNYTAGSTRGYPYKTTMQNAASSWLIYNKYNSSATTNEFDVEFMGSGDWVGTHETNTTTIKTGTQRTNRRLMW